MPLRLISSFQTSLLFCQLIIDAFSAVTTAPSHNQRIVNQLKLIHALICVVHATTLGDNTGSDNQKHSVVLTYNVNVASTKLIIQSNTVTDHSLLRHIIFTDFGKDRDTDGRCL